MDIHYHIEKFRRIFDDDTMDLLADMSDSFSLDFPNNSIKHNSHYGEFVESVLQLHKATQPFLAALEQHLEMCDQVADFTPETCARMISEQHL
jgi:hypothetical protein